MQSTPGFPRTWMERTYPSGERRNPAERAKRDKHLALLRMLTKQTSAYQVVRTLEGVVKQQYHPVEENYGFTKKDLEYSFFVKERDEQAFCMIHPGPAEWKPSDGINIIVGHIDIPLLRVRDQPTSFQWDPEKKYSHPGPYLELRPYGGLNPADWEGRTGHIRGVVYTNHARSKEVNIAASISSTSIHLENEEQENSFNRVRAFTGARNVIELHKQLGVQNEQQLGAAELYFMPDVKWTNLNDQFIKTYGLDDRSCVTAAVHACMNASHARPTFVFGLNCEEIGSVGRAGRAEGFFTRVVTNYMASRTGGRRSMQDLDNIELFGYPAICADVTPTMTYNEIEDIANTTSLEAARIGFGPFISTSWGYEGNHVPPRYAALIKDALNTNGGRKPVFQFVGADYRSHEADAYFGSHFAQYFTNQGIPMIAVGTPVVDLHRPGGEMMFIWDWESTIEAYERYMSFKPRTLRRSGKPSPGRKS